ncbi:jacalin-related lectin 35-like [Musa acuminata AAA Group]|uniref:jacalin-related lectin 35-like n=1 Tax=Musa acuminata AAA Group TaxID=214697 RepID=UPI0031E0ED17
MVRARESYVYMASNVIKTAAQARGWGIRKCPCDSESRWGMEPADKITGISVGAASCVNSIKITFEIDGTTGVTPRYGGSDGELFQITLMQDEYLTSVSGYVRHICSDLPCISQLMFGTNLGRTHGPYGGGGGTFFEVNVEYDDIKGFFGYATTEHLTVFGVYVMLA